MADLTPLNYDPSQVEDLGDGFKVVPPGTYNVVIVESDVANTKNGGKMLVLKYQIVDGQYVGDTVLDRINIVNSSDTAQKIGLSQLKNICDAIGHKGQLSNSDLLHGKPMAIKVAIEKFESNKEAGKMLDSNRVEKRMPKQSASVTIAPPQQAKPQQPAAQPW
jgi:hypothetical protein